MTSQPDDLAQLENQRSDLYHSLSRVGDFRRGGFNAVMRRCGKANCACADPAHPGHGPQYNLTRSVNGKTVKRAPQAGAGAGQGAAGGEQPRALPRVGAPSG